MHYCGTLVPAPVELPVAVEPVPPAPWLDIDPVDPLFIPLPEVEPLVPDVEPLVPVPEFIPPIEPALPLVDPVLDRDWLPPVVDRLPFEP